MKPDRATVIARKLVRIERVTSKCYKILLANYGMGNYYFKSDAKLIKHEIVTNLAAALRKAMKEHL